MNRKNVIRTVTAIAVVVLLGWSFFYFSDDTRGFKPVDTSVAMSQISGEQEIGLLEAVKGGVGLASMTLEGGATISALTVVNALGDVLDEDGAILAGARGDGAFIGGRETLLSMRGTPSFFALDSTTLSVVMTDACLDKLQCGIVARMSHDGLARAIDPVHTPVDGDCVFVLATGEKTTSVLQAGVAAAEVVARSIRRAVRAATGVPGVLAGAELGFGR